jgi:hypothetical protein
MPNWIENDCHCPVTRITDSSLNRRSNAML